MSSSPTKQTSTTTRSAPEKSTDTFFQAKGKDSFFGGRGGAPFFQSKLKVHPAGDSYEREADAHADRITQHSDTAPSIQRMSTEEDESAQAMPLGSGISVLQAQRPFDSPTSMEQNSAAGGDEMGVQTKSDGGESGGASSEGGDGIESQLRSSKGGGSGLPEDTRSKMESGFGADFSGVKVHTGSDAVQMNQCIGARAFTHGSDIYFNEGEYRPGTQAGDHLLAHELTHTVQQGASKTGGVQQKKDDTIQRAPGQPSIYTAPQTDLDNHNKTLDPTHPGKVIKNGSSVEIHMEKVVAKEYIFSKDFTFLGGAPGQGGPNIKIKKPRQERDSAQRELWMGKLRKGLNDKIVKDFSLQSDKLYAASVIGKADPKIIGNLERIVNEFLIPFWSVGGKPELFDVEHKVDYQIAGPEADNIDNLILLDRAYNRQLGTTVEKSIDDHLKAIATHYAKKFSNITSDPKATKNKFNVFIDLFEFQKTGLDREKFYEQTDIVGGDFLKHVHFDPPDQKIPKGSFLLMSSDNRAGYILPLTANGLELGGYSITTQVDNKGKLKSITLAPLLKDKNEVLDKKFTSKVGTTKEETPFDDVSENVYRVKDHKTKLGGTLKGLIGGVKEMSPIQMDEPDLDGFNISVSGKVISTLSFLKDVDITFKYANGEFVIKAEVPLTKLAASIPKPFEVKECGITVEASSIQGLSISGNAAFGIKGFGEGHLAASAGRGIQLSGDFDFDSKWFTPANIHFNYAKGDWSIGGSIGIADGTIKGIKSAKLDIEYAKGALTANGEAKLDVPGVDSIKLTASYDPTAGFRFVAQADLKKLPGIKSGSVTVTVLSKNGEIKLGVGGTAEPDFPAVPGLTTSLTVMYEDGIFDMRAKVGYKKGRFDGSVEVGVTNKVVNDKGEPNGEPEKGQKVSIFGFGKLTVDLFKGSQGTIQARLTPEKKLLVAGSFSIKDVSPFGAGVDIHKKIVEFPKIKIPIVGVPGVSIFFEIGGGAYFNFNWQPLVLKELTIGFDETDIHEIEGAAVNIKGSIGSKARAEAYMEIDASLGAQVLIAEIKGTLGGQAGIAVEAEAGGDVSATWDHEKGLQLKEINASVSVNPKAFFRLKGSVSVDLDLWVTTINLYYKEWILAEGSSDLGGLGLKVNFPLKFDEKGDLIRPDFEQLNIEKPDYTGDQGKAVLDGGINGDAQKERKLAKDKLRRQISEDMRSSVNDSDFSPTEYAKKLQKKYADDEEIKQFIMDSVEEEVKVQEYQEFENLKQELLNSPVPLSQKMGRLYVFQMFRGHINPSDLTAFQQTLEVQEQTRQAQAQQNKPVTTT